MSFNQFGPDCPECGFPTHKAEYRGEERYRCVTNSCGVGWFGDDSNSKMDEYDMTLIRHYVSKVLDEADDIDCTEFDHDEIETALWAASGDVSAGVVHKHPDEIDTYDNYEGSE